MLNDKEWNKLDHSVYKEAAKYASILGVIISAPRQASRHIQGISYSQSAVYTLSRQKYYNIIKLTHYNSGTILYK